MLNTEEIHKIRIMYYHDGFTISEIAAKTHHDFKTIRKYIDREDFNRPQPTVRSTPHKLDPYKPTIDSWLTKDLTMPRKQRHTAMRVFSRLGKEVDGFNCGYQTVRTYVKKKNKELGTQKGDPQIPLVHYPAEAQGDFGEAVFTENGSVITGKYFTLEFPFSNAGFIQLNYGENTECLLEALDSIFRFIGGVPREIWFDNASSMVSDVILGGGRKMTERFTRFCDHYNFKPVFMNRGKGNEKGGVENKVGYLRRNILVPMPEFTDLKEYNKDLLRLCTEDTDREHYKKGKTIAELFAEEQDSLLPLPSTEFDLRDYRVYKTNNVGLFVVDDKFTYSVSPKYRNTKVNVRLSSDSVEVLDDRYNRIVIHKRLYNGKSFQSIDWRPYMKYIAQKPRSLYNTALMEQLPVNIRQCLYMCTKDSQKKLLSILAEISEKEGYEQTLSFADKLLEEHPNDIDMIEIMYRLTYPGIPAVEDLSDRKNIPKLKSFSSSLNAYDELIKNGGKQND